MPVFRDYDQGRGIFRATQPNDLLEPAGSGEGNTGEAHENILAYPAFADSAVLQKVEQEREEEYFLPDKRYAAVENGGGVRGEYDSSRFEKKADGTEECEPLRGLTDAKHL